MKNYAKYLDFLENLLLHFSNSQSNSQDEVNFALDGQASTKLRELIKLPQLRESGAFFTSSNLAQKLVGQAFTYNNSYNLILDPSCGAGGLLLEAARKLPVERTVSKTLKSWGKVLAGIDRHEEFIYASRLRLALLAANRGAIFDITDTSELETLLPLLKIGNSLMEDPLYSKANLILMNPPYSPIIANNNCDWANGRVTSAGLFVETAIQYSKPDTVLALILPDVLRSGSRYEKWRNLIRNNARRIKVSSQGRFDQLTDIDVFTLTLKKSNIGRQSKLEWWSLNKNVNTKCIGDFFDVCVGPVVPFRDEEKGPLSPYIRPHNLMPWGRHDQILERRRFNGKLIPPPFVAIRRTSRPNDKYRVVGTLITGKTPIAVENHLIVCKPKDNTIKRCNKLIAQLKTENCNSWFNNRICCRHLTVKAISEYPIPMNHSLPKF